jgi:phage tail sheath protein FI
MATYSRPGVYITEGPFTTNTPVGSQVTPTAFLGTVARGPVVPTRVDSWSQYKTLYGDLTNSSDLGYSVYHFFANGGRTAYVTRVVSSTSVKAESAGIPGTVATVANSALFKVHAKSVGTWANYVAATVGTLEKGVKVIVTQGLRNGIPESLTGGTGTPRTFNLAVYLDGAEVERWTEVSLDPDSPQYAPTIVNNYSNYIDVFDVASTLTAGVAYTITAGTYEVDEVAGTDVAPADADWGIGVASLDQVQGSLLINLVGQTSSVRVNNALSYAETRGNGFVIIDPSPAQTLTAGITGLTDTYSKSSFGAVYYPLLKMPDPARTGSATLRDTYPGGAIAGLYARVEQERTVAKAPAGYAYELRNAYALSISLTESQIGLLYDNHVNSLKAVPGAGIIVNGARTLKKTDITKYVPVRRALNFVKSNVETIAGYSVFEPNGERLWTDLNTRISRFLADFWAAGGLKGRNANESYYVICDATNNPAYSVENGELHVEVGVALQSPAEFIVINISQFAGGASTTAETV